MSATPEVKPAVGRSDSLSQFAPSTPSFRSPGILRRAGSVKKEHSVKFEDAEPFQLLPILSKYDGGDVEEYNELCNDLTNGHIKPAQLAEVIDELHVHAGQLSADVHQRLIRSVLACNFRLLADTALKRYFTLVVLLATTQPNCASDAIKVMVHNLQYVVEAGPLEAETLPADLVPEELRIHDMSLDALISILHVIPMALDAIVQSLTKLMPYLKRPARQQAAYIHSLLRLSTQLPQIRLQLLRIVYGRLQELDLLCAREQLSGGEESPDTEPASTLDTLMLVTFRHLHSLCHPSQDPGRLDWAAAKLIYTDLLKLFEESTLSSPGTVHVQFLLFWLACRRLTLAEHLVDWLWRRVESPQTPAVLRQAAAAYIGSLLARANVADVGLVRATLEVMCSWVHRYLDQQDSRARERADFTIHRPFYAVCQTVFYVFAFRHTEMPPNNQFLPFLRSLNFERMVTSQLNPLRFCLPAVVKNFANVTRHYQLAYCYTVIERNNRIRIPVVVSTSFGSKRLNPEELHNSYFPFDPYLLKQSACFITPHYREYAGESAADSDADSDSESDSEQEEEEMHVDFSRSLSNEFSYGVSPGFRH